MVAAIQFLFGGTPTRMYANENRIFDMTYLIHARDGASRITLRRETREAAFKKARELEDHGWFEVAIEANEAAEKSAGEMAKVTA
jgi:hypothetical protein